ncbi:MAG: hypothetical protein ACLR8Y_04610 [Alistipes indistinctus]
MDATFVKVFDSLGLDAPVDAFADAFAHAGYSLWHAKPGSPLQPAQRHQSA